MDRAAVVIGGGKAEIFEIKNLHFAPSHSDVAIGGEVAYAIVRRTSAHSRNRVIDINEMIVREIWIESHPEQTSLSTRIDR